MAKIVVECSDPNDLDAIEAATEQFIGRCNTTYFRQHQAMVEAGVSENKSESARKIAEETEETPEAVRTRIRRGEKEAGQADQQQSETHTNQASIKTETGTDTKLEQDPTFKSGRGGKREGAGRKRLSEVKTEIYFEPSITRSNPIDAESQAKIDTMKELVRDLRAGIIEIYESCNQLQWEQIKKHLITTAQETVYYIDELKQKER